MDAGVVDGATIELMKRSKPESPKLTEKGNVTVLIKLVMTTLYFFKSPISMLNIQI